MGSPKQQLTAIFDAERSLRSAERALLDGPPTQVSELLQAAVAEALDMDGEEADMRLERLSDLCAQVEGPAMVDSLLAILEAESASVRIEAYEALQDVAERRYAEVARGIERALDRGDDGHAMRELPFLLAEIGEPSARPLITRFLQAEDAEIVGGAVEALVTLGDPAAIEDLQPLADDPRSVEIDDGEQQADATLGELVTEAIEALGEET